MILNGQVTVFRVGDSGLPQTLLASFGSDAAAELWAAGPIALLDLPRTAFFCSSQCPGSAVLKTFDAITRMRDGGRVLIGGFHSVMEWECLGILLRGQQPVIWVPARAIVGMRLKPELVPAFNTGRLLILSPFPPNNKRITASLCAQRNQFVAALANRVLCPMPPPTVARGLSAISLALLEETLKGSQTKIALTGMNLQFRAEDSNINEVPIMNERPVPGEVDDPWEDLIISILAVNQYSLEKTYPILDRLRKSGLTSPHNLAAWNPDEIATRLKDSGCNRGVFMTGLFALRLCSLGVAAKGRGIEQFTRILLDKDFAEIGRLLTPINGIGPKVLRNYRLLQRLT